MEAFNRGKVSVITGLYNVAGFLEKKRLSCVLHQSWHNLEIILINDGSTDGTQEICRQLSLEDSRIVLINKPNGGLGSARNAGLDAATGEYVWFYDVDDEVELDLVEKNVRWMQEFGVDMTVFGMTYTYPDTGHTETSHFKDRLLNCNEEFKACFIDDLFIVPNGNGFVINKFYRRGFLNRTHARFGWQRIQQDELFNLQLYPQVERLYISSEPLYHYFIYSRGNNRSRYIPDRILIYESIFDGMRGFQEDWGLTDERWEGIAYKRFYQGIDNAILFNTFHPNAPRSQEWKKQEVLNILSRPKVRKCLEYTSQHNKLNLEGRLFLQAYRANRFSEIRLLRSGFRVLRSIKHAFAS